MTILKKNPHCVTCEKKLIGRQRSHCSKKCKNKHTNLNNASYIRQRKRGTKRKLKLIELKGGGCEICGYNKNLAVLTFHHVDPKTKLFNLELRNIANYKWEKILTESKGCKLLCHNCHHEIHHPEFDLKKLLT